MKENNQRDLKYNAYVESRIPHTKLFPSLLWAFLIGGAICCLGQGIYDGISALFPSLTQDLLVSYMLVVLIFLAALLTGFGVFDRIAAVAGAGTIIPITGFSNSMASPAMEFKNEGLIFGVSVKMFTVAGPILVNGIAASIIVGLIYYIVGLI